MNQAVINAIIALLPTYQSASGRNAQNLRYLIGQLIRQYQLPKDNWHISQAADNRWNQLTTDSIWKYHYKDVVTCDKLSSPTTYGLYKGASKTPVQTTLNKNDKFHFRQMFHEDHVIPVSLIIDELKNLNVVNVTTVTSILDQMHMCIILKEEDRKISWTKGRSLKYQQTINNVYTPAGIIIKQR